MSAETLPISEAEYGAIESAVLETARGRWFLAEYARRNRQADTTLLLDALARIENSIRGGRATDRGRGELLEIAAAIARAKADICAMGPVPDQAERIFELPKSVDAVLDGAEKATSQIVIGAELVQEIGWKMREQGFDPTVCEELHRRASDIAAACAFQESASRGMRRLFDVLQFVEARIDGLIGMDLDRPHGHDGLAHTGDLLRLAGPPDAAEFIEPATDWFIGPDEHAFEQEPVDYFLEPADGDEPRDDDLASIEPSLEEEDELTLPAGVVGDAPAGPAANAATPEPDNSAGRNSEPVAASPLHRPEAPPRTPSDNAPALPMIVRRRGDPLAAIRALSYEEKIALFS